VRVRADAWSGFDPVSIALEARPAQYAVFAGLSSAFKRLLPALSHEQVNHNWETRNSSILSKGEKKPVVPRSRGVSLTKRKRERRSLRGSTSRQPPEHTKYFRRESVWSPDGTRLSISSFVAILGRRHLSNRRFIVTGSSKSDSSHSYSAGSACSILANQSKMPKSLTAAAQLSGVFPMVMSAR
jgi:hypothetical protein